MSCVLYLTKKERVILYKKERCMYLHIRGKHSVDDPDGFVEEIPMSSTLEKTNPWRVRHTVNRHAFSHSSFNSSHVLAK